MKSKNLWSKTRPAANPYLTIESNDWTWKVLKAYQSRVNEKANPYARWFCAVKSPYTGTGWDYGDTYISDIPLRPEHSKILVERSLNETTGVLV